MLNFGDGNHWHALFEADGTVDADDRQHLLDCYSGIAFAAPAGEAAFGTHMKSIPSLGQSALRGQFS